MFHTVQPGLQTRRLTSLAAMANKLAYCGQKGNENDADDHQSEVILDHRNVPEKIAERNKTADPEQAAQRAE